MLAPGAASAGVAAAIALPALHAMHAAPGALLDDFHFMRWRVLGKVFTVVGDICQLVALNVVERIGEGHVAVGMMMTIGLPVGGDVDQLRPRAVVIEAAEQAVGKVRSVDEQIFERDRVRDGAVVKKQTDAAPDGRWQA